jgi:hypothetical protein
MDVMPSNVNDSLQVSNDRMKEWFNQVISSLEADQFILETNTASEEKKRLYNTLINGIESELNHMVRINSSMFFIKNAMNDYMKNIKERNTKLRKLAFNLTDAKILVWAEIIDDDEESIKSLILSEAKTNANFSKYGFHISSTVVEESDNLSVPSHYKEVNLVS